MTANAAQRKELSLGLTDGWFHAPWVHVISI